MKKKLKSCKTRRQQQVKKGKKERKKEGRKEKTDVARIFHAPKEDGNKKESPGFGRVNIRKRRERKEGGKGGINCVDVCCCLFFFFRRRSSGTRKLFSCFHQLLLLLILLVLGSSSSSSCSCVVCPFFFFVRGIVFFGNKQQQQQRQKRDNNNNAFSLTNKPMTKSLSRRKQRGNLKLCENSLIKRLSFLLSLFGPVLVVVFAWKNEAFSFAFPNHLLLRLLPS